jgi:hypothetical protein
VPFRDLMTRKGTASSKGPAALKRREVARDVKALPSVGRTRAGVRLAASRAAAKTSYRSPRGT